MVAETSVWGANYRSEKSKNDESQVERSATRRNAAPTESKIM